MMGMEGSAMNEEHLGTLVLRRAMPEASGMDAWRTGRARDVDAAGQPRGETERALIDAVDGAAATEDP